jgi:hypothetical protein
MKLRLIENLDLEREISPGIVESGHWSFTLQQAQEMIGFLIRLHRHQDDPPRLAGVITGVRISEAPNFQDRVIFLIRTEDLDPNDLPNADPWNRWWKIEA